MVFIDAADREYREKKISSGPRGVKRVCLLLCLSVFCLYNYLLFRLQCASFIGQNSDAGRSRHHGFDEICSDMKQKGISSAQFVCFIQTEAVLSPLSLSVYYMIPHGTAVWVNNALWKRSLAFLKIHIYSKKTGKETPSHKQFPVEIRALSVYLGVAESRICFCIILFYSLKNSFL